MMKLMSIFKFGDLDDQDEVFKGGVPTILVAIGRHLWLSVTNIVKAIGYTFYLLHWLIYFIFVLVGIGLLGYYIYQVALALFW